MPLLPNYEDGDIIRCLRIEVVPKNNAEDIPMDACEVHIIGKVEPLSYSPADSDEEGDDADEDCSTGACQ
eukprot:131570-Ditylum_brightwellii.AAC.1